MEQVGYLPENVPLYTEMTVGGFLSFAAQAKGMGPRQIKTSIDKVLGDCGLEKVRGRIIGHLSKGFKQRVGLAQALLNNPPVLILDEPTIGLDPSQVVEIRQMIRSLGQERTIILSTHILPEVSQICQKVIIINRGRIVAIDTVSNLTAQLQTSRRIHLTIQGPQEEVLKVLAARPGVLKAGARTTGRVGMWSEMDKDQDIRADLARSIIEKGWGLLEMRSQELSLEEVFVQLVTDEPGDSHEGLYSGLQAGTGCLLCLPYFLRGGDYFFGLERLLFLYLRGLFQSDQLPGGAKSLYGGAGQYQ